TDDPVEREVLADVGRVDTARRHELQSWKRRGDGLEVREAADRLGGEDFDAVQALLERHLDVSRRADAGEDRQVVLLTPGDDLAVQAGRQRELRAGIPRLLRLLSG